MSDDMGMRNDEQVLIESLREDSTPLDSSHLFQTIWSDYSSILTLTLFTLGIWIAPMYYVDDRIIPLQRIESIGVQNHSHCEFQPPTGLLYPWIPEPLPSWSCGFIVVCVPLLIIAAFEVGNRRLWNFHTGVMGVLEAVIATTFLVMILKQFIGGFRPYFIEVCKPDLSLIIKEIGKERYWLNATACTGAPYDVKKAMQSFPSGHTANSFAAAAFSSLYLNAKLKVLADHASNIWVLAITIAPLIGASLISGSMYISYQHHANDIIFGILIGLFLGSIAYRSRYMALLDFRYNDIPLPPRVAWEFLRRAGRDDAQKFTAKNVNISLESHWEEPRKKSSWTANMSRVKME